MLRLLVPPSPSACSRRGHVPTQARDEDGYQLFFVYTTLPGRTHASFLVGRLRIGGVIRDDVYVWGVLDGQNRMMLEAHQVAGQRQPRPLPENTNLMGVGLADIELGNGAHGLCTKAQIEQFPTDAEDVYTRPGILDPREEDEGSDTGILGR
jgi:hypothetical protein